MNKATNSQVEAWDRAFAEQLKAEVENSARTQAEIAAAAGMSAQTLRRYMSGVRAISVVDLRRVLREIPLDMNVFLSRAEQRAEGL